MSNVAVVVRETPILAMIRQEVPSYAKYHPLLAIARLAQASEASSDRDLRLELECHKTIAKYVEPELKSMELRAPPEEHRRVRVSLFQAVDAEEAEYTDVPLLGTTE